MTAQTEKTLPYRRDDILSGEPERLEKYLRELVFALERQLTDNAHEINGKIKTNFSSQSGRWTPVLKDTVNSGTTFTYTNQIGWSLRQGLAVDAWFDIAWTINAGAITGNMYVELPSKVATTSNMPFTGVLQPSGFAFTGGSACVINAISNTFRGEIWNTGGGFTTARQASAATGRLIGHVRYIGRQND